MLHIHGSPAAIGFQDERWYDLIVILDGRHQRDLLCATYEEESTVTVMPGCAWSLSGKACSARCIHTGTAISGSHRRFGGQGGPAPGDAGGLRLARAGSAVDSCLLATGAGAARNAAFGTWQETASGRSCGCAQSPLWRRPMTLSPKTTWPEFNRRFQVPAAQRGTAFIACPRKQPDLSSHSSSERAVNKDNTVSCQNLALQIEPARWPSTLAGWHGDGASASGRKTSP